MNRSYCALFVLLTALFGPLLFVGPARAQICAYGSDSPAVCTPPQSATHPADLPAHDISGEDWRDFVDYGSETTLTECPTADLLDEYNDLFDSLSNDLAESVKAAEPTVVEAEPADDSNYSNEFEDYQPYAEDMYDELLEDANIEAATSEAAPEVTEVPQVPSPEAYESEFSGYDTPDYLRDNFDYEPHTPTLASQPLRTPAVLQGWALSQLDSLLSANLVTDAIDLSRETLTMGEQLASDYPLDRMIAASEDAWDRLEVYNRETAPPLPLVQNEAVGFRLPGDDCGWDCWYSYQFQPEHNKFTPGEGVAVKSEPAESLPATECQPSMEDVVAAAAIQRDVLLSVARSLRHFASQLEDASELVARLGGLDIAELDTGSAAR